MKTMNVKKAKHNKTFTGRHTLIKPSQQNGAVMITVLMMLVLITLMGLSSMKQGMFQARLGTAEVSYTTCFMAAESGLNAVYRSFQEQAKTYPIGNVNNFMNQASGSHVKHCLGGIAIVDRSGQACPNGGLSEYPDIQVAILSRPSNTNNQAERDTYATFEDDIDRGGVMLIYTDSRCEVPGVDMAVTNTQAWQHRASNSLPKHSNTNI